MNVMFLVGDKVITPGLDAGTILAGVTRDSVITLLKEQGIEVEEREVSIDELVEAYKSGNLKEAFGTGTAATISPISELCYKDFVMKFNIESWKVSPGLKDQLDPGLQSRRFSRLDVQNLSICIRKFRNLVKKTRFRNFYFGI
jgi:branched-chain amino acid aminotransferase